MSGWRKAHLYAAGDSQYAAGDSQHLESSGGVPLPQRTRKNPGSAGWRRPKIYPSTTRREAGATSRSHAREQLDVQRPALFVLLADVIRNRGIDLRRRPADRRCRPVRPAKAWLRLDVNGVGKLTSAEGAERPSISPSRAPEGKDAARPTR